MTVAIILGLCVGFGTQNLGLGFAALIVGAYLDTFEDLLRDIKSRFKE